MDLLRHLSFFTSVAETEHFGEAAQNLGMTQPPLSQGIQRLERRLGVRLFERDARRVQITAAGQRLLPAALELLHLSEVFTESARDLASPEVARIGACPELEDWIPLLFASVASGGDPVTPQVAGSKELVAALHEGQLDAAVLRHPGVVDGLAPAEVQLLPTRLILPPGMAHRGIAEVDLPVAVLPRHNQPTAHDQLLDALRRAGHSGDVTECATLAEATALVAVGAAARLAPVVGRDESHSAIPLRVRVVLPPARVRRQGIDHEKIQCALVSALPA